jgi:N-methylhydantoinase A
MMRLGIDVGGTFIDIVAYDSTTQTFRAWKNMSTPTDPTEGILAGLAEAESAALSGLRLGTTVATNALLEGKGAVVGYVTTQGFRDIPFIGALPHCQCRHGSVGPGDEGSIRRDRWCQPQQLPVRR